MSTTSGQLKEWMSLEGYMQPLDHGGLGRLRENKASTYWFAVKDSSLLCYEYKKSAPVISKPISSIDICTSTLEVFIGLTSKDNHQFLLTPGDDVNLTDWLANLKEKTAFADKLDAKLSFQRSQAPATHGFMNKVRNSLRRKKRNPRSQSFDSSQDSTSDSSSQSFPVQSSKPATGRERLENRFDRSLTLGSEDADHVSSLSPVPEKQTSQTQTQKITMADKACDTMGLEWEMPDINEVLKTGVRQGFTCAETESGLRRDDRDYLKTGLGQSCKLAKPGSRHDKTKLESIKRETGSRHGSDRVENVQSLAENIIAGDFVESGHIKESSIDGFVELKREAEALAWHQHPEDVSVTCCSRVDGAALSRAKRDLSDDTLDMRYPCVQAVDDDQSPLPSNIVSLPTSRGTPIESRVIEAPQGRANQSIELDTTQRNPIESIEEKITGIALREDEVQVKTPRLQHGKILSQDSPKERSESHNACQGVVQSTCSSFAKSRNTPDNPIESQDFSNARYESRDISPMSAASLVDDDGKAGSASPERERDSTGLAPKERWSENGSSIKLQSHFLTRDLESMKEALTLQQQKIIRELEVEVSRLKCEVISLIQGSIQIPLKDDDLADWHYVEEIRYKDRIFELLREARLCNPRLPNFDSSKSGSFRDGYGFLHGSRESESVVFHYVCRELTQHYSTYFQNNTGQVQFFQEYIESKKRGGNRVLYKEKELKTLFREGIPTSCRRAVWLSLTYEKVESLMKAKAPNFYQRLASKITKRMHTIKEEMSDVERQIKCDLLRTMPTNENFKSLDSPMVKCLSRILHCFADYMPEIGYLQGMNFLVGLFLLFMGEEEAFWSLVAVVQVYLKGYFDEFLIGAQADQEVLKELVCEKLPALHAHFKYYGVDLSTVTFNWLITIYLDAVPFETGLRIWDCFLYEGREVLFRVAIGLLKLQQRALLQLSGPLEIMQYMKRAARVTYDVDRLFKASFDEISTFPSNADLDVMQSKHRSDIEQRLDGMSISSRERKRSRVDSFTVEIPSPGKQEKLLDQYQIVECAVATSKDLSRPVGILCSSRGGARLYLLDINKKEMSTLDAGITSRVLCAEVLEDGTLLVGTIAWFVHAFNIDAREELWSVQLRDSVIDLTHYYNDEDDNRVYAALADGSIAVLPNAHAGGSPSMGSHVRIGSAPVTCVAYVSGKVWCGCGNNVVVLDASSLEELHSAVMSPSPRHQVGRLLAGDHGVWCTIRGSSWVLLINSVSYEILLKVDVSLDTDASQPLVTVSPFQETRVTTVMAFGEELWVGLGNGQVIIFDVIENKQYHEESFVLLKPECGTAPEPQDVVERVSDTCTERVRDRSESCDTVSIECKLALQRRILYRVSEDAIRSLVILRESEPLVLSCAGQLSAEGGLSLWQQQTELDSCEWINCPVRHKIRPQTTKGSSSLSSFSETID
ncbi:uncharacterized protein LOC5507434 isoform X2 [Nematostella vectensis]|uniref:uncharacterized protein LOC5507434 isoform X2 n=1 Tax=Nematostella vectensis TaxID=45351 RepID=UPI0020773C41|nr:uncharacterized protein LOC5507434 isoform X2 [Nematostella vectensis]